MTGEHSCWKAHLHPPTQSLSKARENQSIKTIMGHVIYCKELTFMTVWLGAQVCRLQGEPFGRAG